MDGIHAMEGNGPRGGSPKKMNVLLFSEDPIALDATACRLINLDPALVPTTVFGQEAGRGTFDGNKIELLGDDFNSFVCKEFNIDRSPVKPFKEKGILTFIGNRLVARPAINREKCTRCGTCIKVCPTSPKSVDWKKDDHSNPPEHNYRTCIRCYCCQELCPENAIDIRKPLLRRIFGKKKG